MIGPPPVCLDCRHFIGGAGRDSTGEGFVCKAYPDGIPQIIILGGGKHDKPRKGDHGIQFEPKEQAFPHDGSQED